MKGALPLPGAPAPLRQESGALPVPPRRLRRRQDCARPGCEASLDELLGDLEALHRSLRPSMFLSGRKRTRSPLSAPLFARFPPRNNLISSI